MARSAPKPCAEPGCPKLVHDKHSRCDDCRGEYERLRGQSRFSGSRRHRRTHDSFYQSAAWRKLRTAFARKNPLCVRCLALGITRPLDVVDHIEERVDDDSLRLRSDNLQGLCHPHHAEKTREARLARQKKTGDLL